MRSIRLQAAAAMALAALAAEPAQAQWGARQFPRTAEDARIETPRTSGRTGRPDWSQDRVGVDAATGTSRGHGDSTGSGSTHTDENGDTVTCSNTSSTDPLTGVTTSAGGCETTRGSSRNRGRGDSTGSGGAYVDENGDTVTCSQSSETDPDTGVTTGVGGCQTTKGSSRGRGG